MTNGINRSFQAPVYALCVVLANPTYSMHALQFIHLVLLTQFLQHTHKNVRRPTWAFLRFLTCAVGPSSCPSLATVTSKAPMPSPPPTNKMAGSPGSKPNRRLMARRLGRLFEKSGRMGRPACMWLHDSVQGTSADKEGCRGGGVQGKRSDG
jgi:hypothetical protein